MAENQRRALNIKRGIRAAQRSGRHVNAPPIGYERRYDERGRAYIAPDKERAPLIQEAFHLVATTEMTLDAVRRRLSAKACSRGLLFYNSRYRFGQMLRNRVYLGEVHVPAFGEEPEEWVGGNHEALIDRATFERVARRIEGREPGRKYKLREELPLRGHLLCPHTGACLTGSASRSRHGYRVWYYHGQGRGAYRVRADEANQAFLAHLARAKIAPEVAILFEHMLEEAMAAYEEERTRDAARLSERWQDLEAKLLRTDEAFIEGRIAQDSYERLKAKYAAEREAIAVRLAGAQPLAGAAGEQIAYGLGLLARLDEVFVSAGVEGKHALVGSIFPGGLIYQGGDYRTSPPSELLYLLSGKNVSLSDKQKTGHPALNVPNVPSGGDGGNRTRVRMDVHVRRLHV